MFHGSLLNGDFLLRGKRIFSGDRVYGPIHKEDNRGRDHRDERRKVTEEKRPEGNLLVQTMHQEREAGFKQAEGKSCQRDRWEDHGCSPASISRPFSKPQVSKAIFGL